MFQLELHNHSQNKSGEVISLPRISQMICLNLACDLRQTLETQGYFAHLCHADRGTQWVTAKMRICGLVLTAA